MNHLNDSITRESLPVIERDTVTRVIESLASRGLMDHDLDDPINEYSNKSVIIYQ